MISIFRWDPQKARSNLRKHGVSFEGAGSVFRDTLSTTIGDPLHSFEEERFVPLGLSDRGRILVVVHSELRNAIRIISARIATRSERKRYDEGAL